MNDSPRGATKLGSLETGRFIAASMVMLEHFADFTQQYAAPGQRIFGNWSPPAPLGVEFFFVLSGFVMASAHHADFGRLAAIPRFWWRRACRIYPVYWLALCVPMYLFWRSLGAASLLHLYLLDPWGDISLIPPSWTLRYEMAFYIALGLCMLPYIGKPLLGLWIATTLWCHMPLGLLAFFHLEPPFSRIACTARSALNLDRFWNIIFSRASPPAGCSSAVRRPGRSAGRHSAWV